MPRMECLTKPTRSETLAVVELKQAGVGKAMLPVISKPIRTLLQCMH